MIVFNFDVLARPGDSLATRQPDPDGRAVWSMLFDKYTGRICVVSTTEYDRTQLEEWLKREKFKASSYDFIDFIDPALRAERVHIIGSAFGRINWYVDNDAATCAETLKLGIPTMVIASPYIIRPEWDGGRKLKGWDSLVDEINSQALKAAERDWRDL